jgi:hypothetical protein
MRKDFIRSEEEKQRRRECLEENRNNSSTLEPTNLSHHLSNPESIAQTLDEIDRVSFYFLTLTQNFQ